MSFVDNQGVKIYWDELGSGEPLLLINGLGTSAHLWHRSRPSAGFHRGSTNGCDFGRAENRFPGASRGGGKSELHRARRRVTQVRTIEIHAGRMP